ncbi:MAG: hypothetical protein ABII74_06495 [Elusimicrobiota bacterium]
MKKFISLCLLLTFVSLIALTSFHVHEDVVEHKDCSKCILTSLLSSAISSAEIISDIDFNSSYIVLGQPHFLAASLIQHISNRGPPVLL